MLRDGLRLRIHPESRLGFEHFCFIDPQMVDEFDAFLAHTPQIGNVYSMSVIPMGSSRSRSPCPTRQSSCSRSTHPPSGSQKFSTTSTGTARPTSHLSNARFRANPERLRCTTTGNTSLPVTRPDRSRRWRSRPAIASSRQVRVCTRRDQDRRRRARGRGCTRSAPDDSREQEPPIFLEFSHADWVGKERAEGLAVDLHDLGYPGAETGAGSMLIDQLPQLEGIWRLVLSPAVLEVGVKTV